MAAAHRDCVCWWVEDKTELLVEYIDDVNSAGGEVVIRAFKHSYCFFTGLLVVYVPVEGLWFTFTLGDKVGFVDQSGRPHYTLQLFAGLPITGCCF